MGGKDHPDVVPAKIGKNFSFIFGFRFSEMNWTESDLKNLYKKSCWKDQSGTEKRKIGKYVAGMGHKGIVSYKLGRKSVFIPTQNRSFVR